MLYFSVASIAAILSAITIGISFVHLLDMKPHVRWAHNGANAPQGHQPRRPVSVAMFPSAILAFGFFAYLNIGRVSFHWSLAAILCAAAALATWFALVAPISASFARGAKREPPKHLRDLWEGAHALIAALNVSAFAALIGALLVQRA
jgi:hypothetical protein